MEKTRGSSQVCCRLHTIQGASEEGGAVQQASEA